MNAVGKKYRYVAAAGRQTGRYGQIVTVLAWHKSRVLVRFPDGWEAVTTNRCLQKLSDSGLFEEMDEKLST